MCQTKKNCCHCYVPCLAIYCLVTPGPTRYTIALSKMLILVWSDSNIFYMIQDDQKKMVIIFYNPLLEGLKLVINF